MTSAQTIANTFSWKEGVTGNNGYFVSLINNELVYATDARAVIGITLKQLPVSYQQPNPKQSVVLLFGIVQVHDNGSCVAGGKCTVLNNIATVGTQWLVLNRINSNTITILYK